MKFIINKSVLKTYTRYLSNLKDFLKKKVLTILKKIQIQKEKKTMTLNFHLKILRSILLILRSYNKK